MKSNLLLSVVVMTGMYSEIKQVRPYISLVSIRFINCACPGNESHAVVEFAPYQKIPSEKKKVDARTATIEKGMFSIHSLLTLYH